MKFLVLSLVAALVFVPAASALTLQEGAVTALESVAGPGIRVDCHLQRPEALGHAYKARRVIGVRPWVCRRVNVMLADPAAPYSAQSYGQAFAVLILTHEAVHLSDYAGADDEALTECRAIQLVREVALAFGLTDDVARALGHEAMRYDAKLPGYDDYRVGLGEIPSYHATGCSDGGPLDIHPESHDWPN
jgi:hypothetical protein